MENVENNNKTLSVSEQLKESAMQLKTAMQNAMSELNYIIKDRFAQLLNIKSELIYAHKEMNNIFDITDELANDMEEIADQSASMLNTLESVLCVIAPEDFDLVNENEEDFEEEEEENFEDFEEEEEENFLVVEDTETGEEIKYPIN